MPTYEYICDACGNEFEKFQSMSAEPIKKCPKCGKNKVHRKIGTGAGIIFKGGGFYETDYRGDSYKKAAEAEKGGGEAKTDAKSDAVTETKPAAAESNKPEPAKSDVKPATPDSKPAAKAEAKTTKASSKK